MKEMLSILFIEESENSNQDIKNGLEKSGYTLVPFSQNSLNHLPTLLDAHKWDLIFLDLDLTGIDVTKALSILDGQLFNTPLIIIGSNISKDVLYDAMRRGAQDYVEKTNLERLLPVVSKEVRNLKKQRRYADTLFKKQLFDQILQRSTNEVFLIDPMSLKIFYANDSLIQNIGYSEEELYQMRAINIVADYDAARVSEAVSPLYQGNKKSVNLKFDRQRQDGSTYPVQLHVEITRENDRQVLIGISFDMSQQAKDAAIIKQQKKKTKELELNSKHKSEFFANVSHEIRTILNSSLLLTNVLAENRFNNLNTQQVDHLKAMRSSNSNVLQLLNGMLDLSKIESGNIDVQLEKLPLSDFSQRMERLYKPIAREKNLHFSCHLNGLAENVIFSDRLRIEQVLNNLISNAIKFTKKGSVNLHISKNNTVPNIGSTQKKNPFILFEVKDTGIGISKEEQPKIFKSYVQANGAKTRKKFGGTGLGLTISKEIAQMLGGDILLESQPENGSTFKFYVPEDSRKALVSQQKTGKVKLTDKVESATEFTENASKKPNGKAGSILLIDDSTIHNMALKEFLSLKVENCLTADSAKQAYDLLEKHPVDGIILDMYLPDADGKEVLQKLKADEQFSQIPVIIYSGKSMSGKEEKVLAKHAEAIVQKNALSYNKLLNIISNILEP